MSGEAPVGGDKVDVDVDVVSAASEVEAAESPTFVGETALDKKITDRDTDSNSDAPVGTSAAEDGADARPHRSGFVGILGRPNVGKSTLMNRIIGVRLAITTPKPQTTRDRIRGIRTWDDWQVTYIDTPGIHEARTRLNRYMVDLALGTIDEVDLAYLLVDSPKLANRPDKGVAELKSICENLASSKTPVFLVLNKVDQLKDKSVLLAQIEQLQGLRAFADIIPISARRGTGVDTLLELTRARLPEGPPLFDADTLTDRPLRFLAQEIIREQVFMQLGQELPFNSAVKIIDWEERPGHRGKAGLVAIHANIHVMRKSHKPIVVGRAGSMIKRIGQRSRHRLEKFLDRKVFLDLRVKVDEGWIDRPNALRDLGYGEQD